MSRRASIKGLKEVAIDGFAGTLSYVLAVGEAMERTKALQILSRLIGERKIAWG